MPRLENVIQLLTLACGLFFGVVSTENEVKAEVSNFVDMQTLRNTIKTNDLTSIIRYL